jgi:hypothetical protein
MYHVGGRRNTETGASKYFFPKIGFLLNLLTEIPCQSTPRTKAHKKIGKNHPSLQQNTMGRADKSALVTKAVLAIRQGEFKDYSNATKKFYYSYIAVIRRIKG